MTASAQVSPLVDYQLIREHRKRNKGGHFPLKMAAIHLGLFRLKSDNATQSLSLSLCNSMCDRVSCVSLCYEQVTLIACPITPTHWTTD